MTDKIECGGNQNNWKIFFRVPIKEGHKLVDEKWSLKAYTMRIRSSLIPPLLTEDPFTFSTPNFADVKGFGFDFSYLTYVSIIEDVNITTETQHVLLVTHNDTKHNFIFRIPYCLDSYLYDPHLGVRGFQG